jgi:dipeptidyl aminopeptidase/acylaminoacyl peptidase
MTRGLTALAALILLAGTPAGAQTPAAESTDVIVKGSLRPRPAEGVSPPPLDVFVKSPRIEHIALSPDGSRFAFVTWTGGVHILTAYTVGSNGYQHIPLDVKSLTAITWLDNDHILLSQTQTALRSTCPTAEGVDYKVAQAKIDPRFLAFKKGVSRRLVESPPLCASYGVRSHEAATVVNLRTQKSALIGDRRMSGDYFGMALGLPQPVTVDGKLQLVGAFLELRDMPVAGQVAQRVYLWRVDPDTGIGRIVDDGGGDPDRMGRYVDDWLVDSKGEPIARAHYTYIGNTFTIEIRKDGKWTPVLTRTIAHGGNAFAPSLVGLGRDGTSLLILDAVTAADGSRRFRYFELSADDKRSEALDSGDATRERPIFHPRTGALAGFERDGETSTYTFFDPDLAEYYKLAMETAPGKAVRVAAMGRDLEQMIVFGEGSGEPGTWHYYDFSNGTRVDIGSHHPSVPLEWAASQRSVRYKASDGLEVRAMLTLPPQGEAKNRPLVVLPHDGPLGHDARGFDWLAQSLASRGYVVLQPNYRGSDGYGVAFTEAGHGQWSGRMLSDMADGVRYLAGQGMVDPKRVCIAGRGYGGYAALKGADGGGLYRCAVAINGISDPGDYAQAAKTNALADDIAALKADPQQPRVFRADPASPAQIQRYFGGQTPPAITANAVNAPVLLVHAQYDTSVPAGQSRSLRDGLQQAGKPVTYVELEGCGHQLETEACRLGTAQAVVDFLAANNPAK